MAANMRGSKIEYFSFGCLCVYDQHAFPVLEGFDRPTAERLVGPVSLEGVEDVL